MGLAISYDLSGVDVRMQKTISVALTALVIATFAYGQTPKHWKDQAEFILYSKIVKSDATPAARLENLDKWKADYPQSEFADTRSRLYLLIYQEMSNRRAAFDTAEGILRTQPNDLASLGEIVEHGLQLLPDQPNATLSAQNKNDLDTVKRTGRYILDNLDLIYTPHERPPGIARENYPGDRISIEWGSGINESTWPKDKMQRAAQTAMDRVVAITNAVK